MNVCVTQAGRKDRNRLPYCFKTAIGALCLLTRLRPTAQRQYPEMITERSSELRQCVEHTKIKNS